VRGDYLAGCFMFANDGYAWVPVVEAELRADGTATVLRYGNPEDDLCDLRDLLDSGQITPGRFLLTKDDGLPPRGKAPATKLLVILPHLDLPGRERSWIYQVSNPAPLADYPSVLPPLDLAGAEPELQSLPANVISFADVRAEQYHRKFEGFYSDTIRSVEASIIGLDVNDQEDQLRCVLDELFEIYSRVVMDMPEPPGGHPLIADMLPCVGKE
jgi:hypothetical protein